MKNQVRTVLVAIALIVLSTNGYARTSYTGYSGAPGSKGRCAASCHGVTGGTIEITGFPAAYVPGQTYVVTISHNGGSSISQFNGSCRVGSGSDNAGTITAGTNTVIYSTTGETNGVRLSSTNLTSGTFSWTAPASGTGDVTLYVAGHQGAYSSFNTDLTLMASEMTLSIQDEQDGGLPAEYQLHANYPNPFNPSTVIEFDLQHRSTISIEIFNLQGQRVRQLVNKEYPAGSYQVTWDGTSSTGQPVSTGVYLYRLTAGDFVKTKKMIFLK